MLLKQGDLGCLVHASYLAADEATGTAVVVDPQRDMAQYLYDTTQHGWHIDYVFLTHLHADILARHIELQNRVGATLCLGAQTQAEFAFTPFVHGEPLPFGHVWLKLLETPRHTPEAISVQVRQRRGDLDRERNCRTCME